ncbi:MAG: hypothetical protein ACTSPB_03255 [Candidatus Thorarchaeota archaeon]
MKVKIYRAVVKDNQEETHYDLVEVEWKDGTVGHIPVPFFLETKQRKEWLLNFLRSTRLVVRDVDFFQCQCGNRSFYASLCDDCWWDGVYLPRTTRKEKGRNRRKENILRAIDEGRDLPRTVVWMTYVVYPELYFGGD